MKLRQITCALFIWISFAPFAAAQKSLPPPDFKPGETMFYLVHLKSNRDIKTKSALSIPESPADAKIDVRGILQVEVLPADGQPVFAGTRLRTWFLSLVSDSGALSLGLKPNVEKGSVENAQSEGKSVDCMLQADGQISQITGLEQLSPDQQSAWREWAARFSDAFLIESETHKRGEKWNSEDPETSPSPIAELSWHKKSQYVRDEPCAALKFTRKGDFQRGSAQESCAVVSSTAGLIQKSSAQDSTPPDYKQKGLKTRGSAMGNNEIILYISRESGHLIRATQGAKQQMDVLIALTNGQNQVHYAVNASANSTVELVTELPLILQPKQGN